VPETGSLRSTWRELETWPWLPDCGPSRKRWNHHRRLPVRAPVLDPTWEMFGAKLPGPTYHLYRAVDKTGNTVDFLFRAKRDKAAARGFF
jgi:transposase-like protein